MERRDGLLCLGQPLPHLALLPLDLVDARHALRLELGLPEVGVGQGLGQLPLDFLQVTRCDQMLPDVAICYQV